jgi:putative Holliday junction resolvase
MKILCLDVGNKRIGMAVSDELGITAQGIGVLQRTDLQQDINNILQIVEQYNVNKILIGLPKNMDGTVGFQAETTQEFGELLGKASNIVIEYWDERLTTVAAEKVLISADLSRKKRKKIIDKLAAVIILQNYLDCKIH